MNSSSDMKKAMAAWKVPMQEIKMQLLLLWLSVRQQLITNQKESHSASRCRICTRNLWLSTKRSLFFQTFQGMEGKAKIDGLMDALRNEPPKQVGPFKVTALEDYKKSIRTDIATGETSALTLPESNVLYFELEGGAWFCVRPSGTEPKIKYYAGVKGADTQDATDKLEALSKAVVEL